MNTGTLITKSKSKMKRPTIESSLPFHLPTHFEKVKLKRTWMKGKLDSKILVNRPDKQIVLTIISEDTEINFYQYNDSVTLQVIDGKLILNTQKESIILNEGQLFTINENLIYNLTSGAETVFLLTMVNDGNH